MATATPPPVPNAPVTPGVGSGHDEQIDRRIRTTRWQVKLVEFCSALILMAAGGLAYLLSAAIVDHWLVPLGAVTRWLALLLMIGGVGLYCWKVLLPLILHSIHPLYAARAIEQSEPKLKNSLINFLMVREQPQTVRASVLQTLERRAAVDLQSVDAETSVDRSKLIRMGYVLVAVLAVGVLYTIVSPKSTFQSIGRVMAPWSQLTAPSRVRIDSVEPGDATVDFGDQLEVQAVIHGLRGSDQVKMLYTTSDKQVVQREIEMTLSESGAYYIGKLPERASGVQQSLHYRITAGDAQSRDFEVQVVDSPTIYVNSLRYQYPRYTKLPPHEEKRKGDIHALEGATVTIRAEANQEIRAAFVEFDPVDGEDAEQEGRRLRSIDMKHEGRKASVSFVLQVTDDRRPLYSSYRLRYINAQGRRNPDPIIHRIDVIEDLSPVVEVLTPKPRKIEVPEDGRQLIELRAVDPDFGLTSLGLVATAGEIEVISDVRERTGLGQVVERFDFVPQRLGLKAGDTVTFRGVAEDNRTDSRGSPKHNVEVTPDYQITITDPKSRSKTGSSADPDSGDSPDSRTGDEDPKSAEPRDKKPSEAGAESPASSDATSRPPTPDAEGSEKPEGKGADRGEEKPEPDKKEGPADEGAADEPEEKGGESGEEGAAGGGKDGGEKADENAQQGGPQGSAGKGEPGEEASDQKSEGGAQGQPTGKPGSEGQPNGQPSAGQSGQGQTGQSGGESGTGSPGANGGAAGGPDEPAHDGEAIERIRELIEQQKADGNNNANGQPGQQNKEQSSRDGGQQGGEDTGGSPQGAAGKPKGGQSKPDGGGAASDIAEKSRGQSGGEKTPQQESGDNFGQPGGDAKQGDDSQGRQQAGESSSQGSKPQPQSGGGSPQQEKPGKAGEEKPGQGAGEQKDDRGAPSGKQGSEESKKGSPQKNGKSDAAAPTIDKKTSQTAGDEGGDRTGGGKKGGGQGGQQKGNDRAGGQSSADEGAGASSESGDGDVSASGGDKKEAAGKTGKSGKEKGEGSSSRRAQQGQAADDNGTQQGSPPPQQPNDAASDATPRKSARNGNQRQGGNGTPQGGGLAPPDGDPVNTQPIRDVRDGDKANLDYARKSTDMVLDYLKHNKDDTKLLDDLGWTPKRAEQFIKRWESLHKSAREDPRARRVLEDNLRGLGLRPGNSRTRRQQAVRDQQSVGEESSVNGLPAEFLKQFNAYKRGAAKARD